MKPEFSINSFDRSVCEIASQLHKICENHVSQLKGKKPDSYFGRFVSADVKIGSMPGNTKIINLTEYPYVDESLEQIEESAHIDEVDLVAIPLNRLDGYKLVRCGDGKYVNITRGLASLLLPLLLLRDPDIISRDDLFEILWDDKAPKTKNGLSQSRPAYANRIKEVRDAGEELEMFSITDLRKEAEYLPFSLKASSVKCRVCMNPNIAGLLYESIC